MTIREIAVVARDNRYGLTRDAGILYRGLDAIGIRATVLDRRERPFMDRLRRRKVADTVVHLNTEGPVCLDSHYGPPGAVRETRAERAVACSPSAAPCSRSAVACSCCPAMSDSSAWR